MKITIESTTKVVHLRLESGTCPARIWEGKSEAGIPVICFVTRIAVKNGQDTSQFEKELAEQKPPSAEADSFPLRLIV